MVNLSEIKATHTAGVILAAVGLLSPGMLTMWVFQPELFNSLDTVKFILWSVSLSAPTFVGFSYVSWEKFKDAANGPYAIYATACLFNSSLVPLSITVCHLFGLRFWAHATAMLLLIIFFAVFSNLSAQVAKIKAQGRTKSESGATPKI
jgi:hypothetical protein